MCPEGWLKKALAVQLAALFVAIGIGFRWCRLDGQFRLAGRGEITMRLKKPMAPMARRSLGGEKSWIAPIAGCDPARIFKKPDSGPSRIRDQ
jgi:hypothetical protein